MIGERPVIEVVYALPERQVIEVVPWKTAITIEQAVRSSTLLEQFPDVELKDGRVGIYGVRQALDYPVQPGDRVELYRPLQMSPNDARMRRAGRDRK